MIVIPLPNSGELLGSQLLDAYVGRRGWAGYICSVQETRGAQGTSPKELGAVSSSARRLIELYNQMGFADADPVQCWVRENTTPVIWTVEEFCRSADQRQRELFSLVADQGFQSGISIPLFGPFNIRGTLVALDVAPSIGVDRAIEEVKESVPLGNSLIRCAIEFAQASVAASTLTLTSRETECIKWVAAGKTSWEIALILGISPRTVDFHVQNTMSKLKANSRQQAIYNAMSLGILPSGMDTAAT